MARRHGRTSRFRIEDAAAVVATTPPDALFLRCFGMAAGAEAFGEMPGGFGAVRDALGGSDISTVPLAPAAGDWDFRLPAELGGEALETAVEILGRAEEIAGSDRLAAEASIDDADLAPPGERLDRIVSQRSLGGMLRSRIGLPGWWSLPHVRTTVVNRPDADAWKVRISCLSGDMLHETATAVVESIDAALEADPRLDELPGAIPSEFGTFAIPPQGVLVRTEFARVGGGYWLRSAATLLAAQASETLDLLPPGSRDRAGGPWAWRAAFSSRAGLAAGMIRLGTYGRPPILAIEIEGPFETGRHFVLGMSPRAEGEDADALLTGLAREIAS
ncbi:hypothetical protein [Methylobacterium sp. 092160098-2]|uniref:hypothetical protein n=1 Tax=Methylobacterium sp. 092160098-2 TaxID=3025129 RepID=UPI002381B8EA|nr:hypothetical protein [Methylobacterium sp. 092160098-2]MDE4914919.1 hypothetical protein [Methylobacterium sp. 092160098-2]